MYLNLKVCSINVSNFVLLYAQLCVSNVVLFVVDKTNLCVFFFVLFTIFYVYRYICRIFKSMQVLLQIDICFSHIVLFSVFKRIDKRIRRFLVLSLSLLFRMRFAYCVRFVNKDFFIYDKKKKRNMKTYIETLNFKFLFYYCLCE